MNAITQGRQLFKSSIKPCAFFTSFVGNGKPRISSTTLSPVDGTFKSLGRTMTMSSSNFPVIFHQTQPRLPIAHNQRRYFAAETNNPLSKEHFDMLVNNNKVVVFMKGVPDEPRCGFSNAVVQILRMHGVTNYDSHNVLEDENIRQGIKDYTNWPTIPQVFINGEFIGGCDILLEMHKNGELVQQLSKVGIKSALLDQESKN